MTAASTQVQERARDGKLDAVQALVEDDMQRVNRLIVTRLDSPVHLIPELAGHLVSAGGKRVRPMLTLLAAQLCGYRGERHVWLAAAVEFIHTQRCCTTTWSMPATCAAAWPPPTRSGATSPRAGRRLPVLARVPADGGGRLAAGPGGAVERVGGDRRGRGRPADDRQRHPDHRGDLSRGDHRQDRHAVRGGRRDRRAGRGSPGRRGRGAARATARASASPSS